MNPDNLSSLLLTRRQALAAFGAGAALAGLSALGASKVAAQQAPQPASAGTPQPFTLPPLGYAYDALEPHIDAKTMEIHYSKHHQAYITNANKALADHPELGQLTAEAILRDIDGMPAPIRTALRNNVGGHVNHSFFWQIIAPGGAGEPSGALRAAIEARFGSLPEFKKQFSEAAMKRFGSGWAWLSVSRGQLAVASSANQDSPLSEGATPILGLDVWEHAYYLKHQNVRAAYVAAFWEVANWSRAEANYAAATA
jgi:Fe-Mn family superoxide dismutase